MPLSSPYSHRGRAGPQILSSLFSLCPFVGRVGRPVVNIAAPSMGMEGGRSPDHDKELNKVCSL